jgi:hypothetical protein
MRLHDNPGSRLAKIAGCGNLAVESFGHSGIHGILHLLLRVLEKLRNE